MKFSVNFLKFDYQLTCYYNFWTPRANFLQFNIFWTKLINDPFSKRIFSSSLTRYFPPSRLRHEFKFDEIA